MAEVVGNRPTSGPWWRPDRFALRHDKLMARSRILAAVRDFFGESGFVEVETPVLQVSPEFAAGGKATIVADERRHAAVLDHTQRA